jgi:hypothetical protein
MLWQIHILADDSPTEGGYYELAVAPVRDPVERGDRVGGLGGGWWHDYRHDYLLAPERVDDGRAEGVGTPGLELVQRHDDERVVARRRGVDEVSLAALAMLSPPLTSVYVDVEGVSRRALLELQRACPDLTVNGDWLAPRAVERSLAALDRV